MTRCMGFPLYVAPRGVLPLSRRTLQKHVLPPPQWPVLGTPAVSLRQAGARRVSLWFLRARAHLGAHSPGPDASPDALKAMGRGKEAPELSCPPLCPQPVWSSAPTVTPAGGAQRAPLRWPPVDVEARLPHLPERRSLGKRLPATEPAEGTVRESPPKPQGSSVPPLSALLPSTGLWKEKR